MARISQESHAKMVTALEAVMRDKPHLVDKTTRMALAHHRRMAAQEQPATAPAANYTVGRADISKSDLARLPHSNATWSWQIFWSRFWVIFGKMMAVFVGFLGLAVIFGDTTNASFFSAVAGFVFSTLICAIAAYSEGEDAVRKWRDCQSDPEENVN
jgi:hypothetical protein